MPSSPPPSAPRGWPVWPVTWAAILGSSLVGAGLLGGLSLAGEREALEAALASHLGAVAGAADGALHELPVETLAALGGAQSGATLAERVDNLATHGGLRGLALIGPEGGVIGHGGHWVPLAAEEDLVAEARAGRAATGPLYRDTAGELYQTAYRPLTGHPGWTVAVEGSAATLGAVDTLRRTQLLAGAAVVLVATVASLALATLLSRPIRRLGAQLGAAEPGTPPSAVGDYGFREVRQVSAAARGLLGAIVTRDAELRDAHRREVDQLTRMAAGLAHEVGNPLNAISLSVERLALLDDAGKRAVVVDRVRGQLGELEGIVDRLRDLTRPLRPQVEAVEVGALIDRIEVGAVVTRTGDARLRTDAVLVTQVLRNLLLNATQAGAKRIHVDVQESPITIEVRDDGPGIADADQERIFDWFHTSRAAGSGLGLPVSRRIAEALGGGLTLVSLRPAVFRLTLAPEAPCFP